MKPELKIKLEKVVVNAGIGRLSQMANFEDKILPEVMAEFAAVTGQKPMIRGARKSIAGFKMREGNIVGLKATLRGNRMMDFLSRLINSALPRVRDFRGLDPKAVDENGNLTIGIKEHIVFPEVDVETVKTNFGLEATVVPRLRNREAAMELYKQLGIPFKKDAIVKKGK